MSDARQALGRAAESAARELLTARGLSNLAANVRTRAGELDLVMRDGALLVIVEVRCRSSAARYGGAVASVDCASSAGCSPPRASTWAPTGVARRCGSVSTSWP